MIKNCARKKLINELKSDHQLMKISTQIREIHFFKSLPFHGNKKGGKRYFLLPNKFVLIAS